MSYINARFQNQTLYDKLREFCFSACEFLNECLRKGEVIERIPVENISLEKHLMGNSLSTETTITTFESMQPSLQKFIQKHTEEIEKLAQCQACVEYMMKDSIIEKIKPSDPKLKIIEPVEELLWRYKGEVSRFLKVLVQELKSFEFNDEVFEKIYETYENYLYSGKTEFELVSPLLGFKCGTEEILLGDKLRIRKFSEKELVGLWQKFAGFSFPFQPTVADHGSLSLLNYFARMTYIHKKGEPYNPTAQEKTFDELISALRLFKSGEIEIDECYHIPLTSWSKFGPSFSPKVYRKYSPCGQYELKSEEIKEFQQFWERFKKINAAKNPRLDLAIRRFNSACEKQNIEDKLIDLMVAFECLFFKKDERGEYRHKLSTRVAKLLQKEYQERKKIATDIRKAYDLRSEVVHGGNAEVGNDFLLEIEEYLRKSIKFFLGIYDVGLRYPHDESIDLIDLGNSIEIFLYKGDSV